MKGGKKRERMMIKIKQHRIHYHVFMCLYSVQKAVTIHRHDTPFTDLNKQKKCAEKGKKKWYGSDFLVNRESYVRTTRYSWSRTTLAWTNRCNRDEILLGSRYRRRSKPPLPPCRYVSTLRNEKMSAVRGEGGNRFIRSPRWETNTREIRLLIINYRYHQNIYH